MRSSPGGAFQSLVVRQPSAQAEDGPKAMKTGIMMETSAASHILFMIVVF